MSSPFAFRAAYACALGDYLRHPTEADLSVAYELARDAVNRHLSVLELAVAHQEALLSALAGASAEEVEHITRAASDFFLEGLSAFEMVQRGFQEARLAASLERRQTELSRQLSAFLADASIAEEAYDSIEEMLRLVAEQACEIVGAVCCVATIALPGQPRAAEAASYPEAERRWATLVRWLDLLAIYRLVRASGGSMRVSGDELECLPLFHSPAGARPLQGWLAASLTALDGSQLGAIQLFDKRDGAFTGDDESAVVHLAQIASAAVERARLYQERRVEGD
jgi:hypothetical protein